MEMRIYALKPILSREKCFFENCYLFSNQFAEESR